MAGTAPTEFYFTRMRDAGPVHCSVWLCSRPNAALKVVRRQGQMHEDAHDEQKESARQDNRYESQPSGRNAKHLRVARCTSRLDEIHDRADDREDAGAK
jgi:hypothetical protein